MKKIVVYKRRGRTYFKQYSRFLFIWFRQFIYYSDENIDDIIDAHIAAMVKDNAVLHVYDSRVKTTHTQGTQASDMIIEIAKKYDGVSIRNK